MFSKNQALNLWIYSIGHALVDLVSVLVIFRILAVLHPELALFSLWIILYDGLAFAFQPFLGYFIDRFNIPKLASQAGLIALMISLLVLTISPWMAVILAGVGNALFHLGGGSISLSLSPGKATAPGIFVAPGAIGLFLGMQLAKFVNFPLWPWLILLISLIVVIYMVKAPFFNFKKSKPKINDFWLILIMILLVIATRSLVGSVLVLPWKSQLILLVIFTLSVSLGKALGGILADRYGFMKVGVSSLLISIPLLFFGASYPVAGILGILFFQMSMPITLTLLANIFYNRPAFAFGLTCLALFIGGAPIFTNMSATFSNIWFIIGLILCSSVALFNGTKLFLDNKIKI